MARDLAHHRSWWEDRAETEPPHVSPVTPSTWPTTGHGGRTGQRQSRPTYRPSLPGLAPPQVMVGGQGGDRAAPLIARHSQDLRTGHCLFAKFFATLIFECSFRVVYVITNSCHSQLKWFEDSFDRFMVGSRFTCKSMYLTEFTINEALLCLHQHWLHALHSGDGLLRYLKSVQLEHSKHWPLTSNPPDHLSQPYKN